MVIDHVFKPVTINVRTVLRKISENNFMKHILRSGVNRSYLELKKENHAVHISCLTRINIPWFRFASDA